MHSRNAQHVGLLHIKAEFYYFYNTGAERTQPQLPKIMHPKQPQFADVANVSLIVSAMMGLCSGDPPSLSRITPVPANVFPDNRPMVALPLGAAFQDQRLFSPSLWWTETMVSVS
ncbi:hypothetical protein CEXT_498711 [Caerostris extrusa]|uniref:Uncharacterized protein n=1 Tax=Caerostris extrusa TaxID=172846 RepID=A0AAV4TK99_CAEEX|nr:hypothetical protein CEXT_498711 [Caerostris extrusa]